MNTSGASPTSNSVTANGRLPNNADSPPSPVPGQEWLGPSIQMLDSPTRATARKLDYPPEEDSLFRDSSETFSPGAPDFANWNSNNTQPQTPVFNSIFTDYAPSGHATPASTRHTTTTTTTSTASIPVYTTTTTTVTSTHAQPGVRVSSSLGDPGLAQHVLDNWGSGVIAGSVEAETDAQPGMYMEVEYPTTDVLLDEIWRRDPAVVTEVESYVLWAAACQETSIALDVLQYHDIAYHPKGKNEKGRGWHPEHCPLSAAIALQRKENLQILLARGAKPGDALLNEVRAHKHPDWVKALFIQHGHI